MIGIRQEQITALSADRRTDFKRRLVAHLREHYAAETAPFSDPQLLDYAERCIERAKKHYDITTERGVAYYVQLHWVLGLDFEASPRWRVEVDLLHHPSYHPTDRAKLALAFAFQLRARGA